MRLRSIVLSVALGAIAVTGVWARQSGPAQLALEAARKVEVVDRDLKGAVVRYRDVVSTYPKDRAVVPEALLAMAGCLEQLGQPPEARATYERVVKEYPDTAPAKAAQKKLTALGKAGSGFTIAEIDGDMSGAPSLDGGYMSFAGDTGDLAVRDLKTGQARRVTTDGNYAGDYVFASVPSPDGKQIAYVWGHEPTELRMISSRGGPAKVICCENLSPEMRTFDEIEPHGWSMDSKQVLFSMLDGTRDVTQIVTMPAAGGAPRVVKTVKGSFRSVTRASWSPDGQFIIYDAPRVAGAPEHALFIMRADGKNSAVLIPSASDDKMLDWFPDGKRILFASDRMGTYAAFTQGVADGKAVGEALNLGETLGDSTIQGQGFTRDGSYHYRTQGTIQDILTFQIDASGAVSGGAVRLSSRINNGRQGATWSPDGSQIAYVQKPSILGGQPSLSVQTVATGKMRTVSVDLAALANPAWMPDGLAVIAEGITAAGGQGLFRIELGNGAVSPIGEANPPGNGRWRYRPLVSLDGQEVLYLQGRTIQARSLSSGSVRVVFEGLNLMSFALSPDGRSIAVGARDKGLPPIQIVPIGGGKPRGLGGEADPRATGPGIAWSPDGRWVWFTHIGGYKSSRVSADGGPVERISGLWQGEPQITRLSVAPNGSAAVSTQTWVNQQWVMRNIPPIVR